jgi:hypothetical protein
VELLVTGATGQVERGDLGGNWRPLSIGDQLRPDEQVRTGAGSGAELAAGERSRLSVGERTQLALLELTDAVHHFQLARGVVGVDYRPDADRVVRIGGASERAPVAESHAARFHVVAGDLYFAVATESGGVTLTAGGRTVSVLAGQYSQVGSGGLPVAPADLPTAVLLKVAEASRLGPTGRCLDTVGRADPAARVTVDDAEVPVGADGRFPIRVPRSEREAVTVRAVLPDGRVALRTLRCREDPEARIRDLRMRWESERSFFKGADR